MSCLIGIDTGGTHTDLVLFDEAAGRLLTLKVPTTPADNSVGVIDGIQKILALAELAPSAVDRLAYGTTVVTNLLIQRNADTRVALITTEGFRDVLEIQRGARGEHVFDVAWKPQAPIVPRDMRFTVKERISKDGEVLVPLDEAALKDIATRLHADGVDSIVVAFLNAYVNPTHEQQAARTISSVCPGASITLSSDVSRQFREYERTSTAAINAYVRKPLSAHLRDLHTALRHIGVHATPYIMRANGGLMTFDAASTLPVAITHSGPTAGIMAGVAIGEASGVSDLITFDMGGTSSDVSLIRAGKPTLTNKGNIEGWPVILPMLDLVTVGAGGGTIAWLDDQGILKSGPLSAGSVPGPACYDQGGENPTITDSNLLLGRLHPEFLLAGARRLNAGLAEKAMREKIADPLGMTVTDAARGVIAITESHMVNAVKQISVRRGLDPRDFTLVGFGGAGPLHALGLADQLDIRQVLIPAAPGNFSAMGQLVGDIRHDFALTRISELSPDQAAELNARLGEMIVEGGKQLAGDRVEEERRVFVASLDLCYWGQNHELPISVTLPLTPEKIIDAQQRFHAEHHQAFGFNHPNRPIKFVNLRVAALGKLEPVRLRRYESGSSPAEPARRRRVTLSDGVAQDVPVYAFDTLRPGHRIDEPAIVEYAGSTLFVPPGWRIEFDSFMTARAQRNAA